MPLWPDRFYGLCLSHHRPVVFPLYIVSQIQSIFTQRRDSIVHSSDCAVTRISYITVSICLYDRIIELISPAGTSISVFKRGSAALKFTGINHKWFFKYLRCTRCHKASHKSVALVRFFEFWWRMVNRLTLVEPFIRLLCVRKH